MRLVIAVPNIKTTLISVLLLAAPAYSSAQPPPAAPAPPSVVTLSGSLRTRAELWDWFDAAANNDYVFSGSLLRIGARQTTKRYGWNVEVAAPILVGLPDDAIAAAPQGQLGLGASYYAANSNHRNPAALFLKQGYLRLSNLSGVAGQSLLIGRSEFIDGAEVAPRNPTLAALKRDRIAHRLIGNFGFTHVGRSLDGLQYVLDKPTWNVTAVGARPTQGVFQANGWGELKANLVYAAVTHQLGPGARASEWRGFVLGYQDRRTTVLKTDNRPLAIRQADGARITVTTFGGHYIGASETAAGTIDVLMWAAAQAGSWGALSHRAVAAAAEAGWQPGGLPRLRPWIRGGYDVGSGDGDPSDGSHGTFFQVLPTPRVYARLPFFNMMNSSDAFAEVVLRPTTRLTVRVDGHALRLTAAKDLWYSGGGAFEPDTFGFAGRPSNGEQGLASLFDTSADYTVNPHLLLTGYVGLARGGRVVTRIYPTASNAAFGYVEATLRF